MIVLASEPIGMVRDNLKSGVANAPRCPVATLLVVGLNAFLSRQFWGPPPFLSTLEAEWRWMVDWALRPGLPVCFAPARYGVVRTLMS